MKTNELVSALKDFSNFLNSRSGEAGIDYSVHSHDEPFWKCFRKEIPAVGISKKSGIYFISSLDGDVLYIGKATKSNLGGEIYDNSFSAATIVDAASDIPRFEKSGLARKANTDLLREEITSGNVLIHAVAIEPAIFSSLFEVYLQTLCAAGSDKKLPPLNFQIG